jgi:predicted RNA-binding protein YlxR (DUF448 family)
LLRFAARDGVLVVGRCEAGRGAYTCRDVACFERAVERRQFARVLKQNVHIDRALRRLYTGAGSDAGEAAVVRRRKPGS